MKIYQFIIAILIGASSTTIAKYLGFAYFSINWILFCLTFNIICVTILVITQHIIVNHKNKK